MIRETSGLEVSVVRDLEGAILEMGLEEVEIFEEIARQQVEQEEILNPLCAYVPNGAIEKVVRVIGMDGRESDHAGRYIYILAAANGVGKTAGVLAILGNIMWGRQSSYFAGERYEFWRYPKEFWYVSEQTTLKEVVCGINEGEEKAIQKWFPRGRYTFTKAGLDFFSYLTTDTGWSGSFKTFDMEPKKFESATLGVVIFDEPPPEPLFNAAISRLRMGGIIIMPMTPLFSAAWVEERLLPQATEDGAVYVLEADIWENCIETGTRGILSKAFIERMIEQYDDEEREARAYGRFMHLVGLIYKGMHQAKHRFNDVDARRGDYKALESFSQDSYRIFNVCDPHDAKPPLLGWFAVDRFENVKVIKEFPSCPEFLPFHKMKSWKLTTMETCERIRDIEKEARWNPREIIRVMDPNFGNKPQQAVGCTVAEYFARCGRKLDWSLRYSTSVNDDLAVGHRIVRDFLAINSDGDTRMQFGESLYNIWHDMTHYAYKRVEGKKLDQDGPGERVAFKYKDGADLVRYFIMYARGPKPVVEKGKLILPEHFQMYGINPYSRGTDEERESNIYDPFNV